MSFVVPESETPETDALTNEAINMGGTPWAWSVEERKSFLKKLFDSHERIEHRLSLAQTEIKGLQAERDLHYTRLAGLLFSGALDKYTGGDVQLWAAEYTKKLTEAQARIAELEKLLGRWLTGPHVINAPLSLINETKYAALKDRA